MYNDKDMIYYTYSPSPAGMLLLVGDGTALTGLHFVDQATPPTIEPDWAEDARRFAKIVAELQAYFAGKLNTFTATLRFEGTAFQKSVWQELLRVPYGSHVSYKELAARIGKPAAVRAVGTALGKNPICILGPCHRVIASDGTLGGYASGLKTKQFLLELEQAI